MAYLRKLSMQLASKMRFISAQLLALFSDGAGISAAAHANSMASRLRTQLEGTPGLSFTQPTDANAVFAILDPLGIIVHDHLILGREGHASLKGLKLI